MLCDNCKKELIDIYYITICGKTRFCTKKCADIYYKDNITVFKLKNIKMV